MAQHQFNKVELVKLVKPVDSYAELESLTEVADTLAATHESWTESLMRLPRAEDYEPLVEPLREFARVSPALAETLASVVRAVTPLPALIEPLLTTGEARADGAARSALSGAPGRMADARAAIEDTLASLPRDASYAAAAEQLRELATVSPSLMEWMRQLPALSLPLGESIAALERGAKELQQGKADARRERTHPQRPDTAHRSKTMQQSTLAAMNEERRSAQQRAGKAARKRAVRQPYYWLQTQAPAGNWVDNLGTEDKASAISHGQWLQREHGKRVRVVVRYDATVWEGK